MSINPNSAFVRIYFDLPTPIAVKFDEAIKASDRSKKAVLTEIVSAWADSQTKRGKSK